MDRYTDKILEFGFGKVVDNASWIAAPVIVEKPAPSQLSITLDYIPVNAATEPMKKNWPMLHIKSELADISSSACFASIYLAS